MKREMVGLMIVSATVISLASSSTEEWPVSGLYRIISGDYSTCFELCGFFHSSLPNTNQSYVELALDAQSNTVRMAILGADRHAVFESSESGCTFFLTNGVVLPDHLEFAEPDWSYIVSNSAGGLRINGAFASHPFYFWHANVVAVLVAAVPTPTLSLPRVSSSGAIEFTVFNGGSGQTNFIEASTDLVKWTAIGTNIFPSTDSICPFIDFQEPASTNLAHRYYRSFSLP